MNLILEKTDQVSWFTNMRDVFEAANIASQDYDWYISDIETNWTPSRFSQGDQWMPGDELVSLLREHEVRFIWAVFSAVPKGFARRLRFHPWPTATRLTGMARSPVLTSMAPSSKSPVGTAVRPSSSSCPSKRPDRSRPGLRTPGLLAMART
jgi:hypothetical protein